MCVWIKLEKLKDFPTIWVIIIGYVMFIAVVYPRFINCSLQRVRFKRSSFVSFSCVEPFGRLSFSCCLHADRSSTCWSSRTCRDTWSSRWLIESSPQDVWTTNWWWCRVPARTSSTAGAAELLTKRFLKRTRFKTTVRVWCFSVSKTLKHTAVSLGYVSVKVSYGFSPKLEMYK